MGTEKPGRRLTCNGTMLTMVCRQSAICGTSITLAFPEGHILAASPSVQMMIKRPCRACEIRKKERDGFICIQTASLLDHWIVLPSSITQLFRKDCTSLRRHPNTGISGAPVEPAESRESSNE
jgi:hypothetical protein